MSDVPAVASAPEATISTPEIQAELAPANPTSVEVTETSENARSAVDNILAAGEQYANNVDNHEKSGHIASLRNFAENLPLMDSLQTWWAKKDKKAKEWWIKSSILGNVNPLAGPKRAWGSALAGLILIGAIKEDEATIKMVENEVTANANIASVLLTMISALGITAPITMTLGVGVQAVRPLLQACAASRKRQAPTKMELVGKVLTKGAAA